MSVRTVPASADGLAKPVVDVSMGDVTSGDKSAVLPTQDPDNPLHRKVDAYVRANLAELSNDPKASVWSLSESQLESVFKPTRYTSANANVKVTGQLASTVVHSIDAIAMKSTFPIQLGVKILGVDNTTFSSIGNPYSMIVMSETSSNIPIELQKEDVSVAYDFARRFPGYNAHNLRHHNVTPVPQRNMFFVDKGHPIVSVIQASTQSMQTMPILDTPDQLIKVSDQLMDALMPVLEEQVQNTIKVEDLNQFHVQISPADYPSWAAAAEALSKEAVAPIRARQKRALAAANGDSERIQAINRQFEQEVDEAQQTVATTPLEFSLQLNMMYNFI